MSDEQLFVERGFGRATGLGDSPCLVIVDVQTGFTDPSRPLGADMDHEIAQINRTIRLCRDREWPVIFTRIAFSGEAAIRRTLWAQKINGLRTLLSDGDSVEVDSRLARAVNDDVITKKGASAFFGTQLADRLNAHGCDSVIVTGCSTSGCVRATVVDAIQHGYRPLVLADAVGDRSAISHQQALVDMRHKYADVESTDAFISHVRHQA